MRIRTSFENEKTGLRVELDLEEDIPAGPVEEYYLRACDLARVFSATLAEQIQGIVEHDVEAGRHKELRDLVNSTERRCSNRVDRLASEIATLGEQQSQHGGEIQTLGSSVGAAMTTLAEHRKATQEWSASATAHIQKLTDGIATTIAARTTRLDELSERLAAVEHILQPTQRSTNPKPARKRTQRRK